MSGTGIIDYGMGNLRSVQKALQSVGAEAQILRTPDQIQQVSKLILPGVGAFADGMEHLDRMGWITPIQQFIASGRPFLGICLGMQLLFDHSQEGDAEGLAILPGQVVRFNEQRGNFRGGGFRGGGFRGLKVPHMGWNSLRWTRQDPLLQGLDQDAFVYFVHGYYVEPAEASLISAQADYGERFCASVWRDNLWAMQFHPEKSQHVGLAILRNFSLE